MDDNLGLGTLLTGFPRMWSQRHEEKCKPRMLGVKGKEIKDKETCRSTHACWPCFTSLEAQQTRLFGQEDIPGRDAKRGKRWEQHLVPPFFLFLIGQEPSELPSLLDCVIWPLSWNETMKPNTSVSLFVWDWEQRTNTPWMGCRPRKTKLIKENRKIHKAAQKNTLLSGF